MDGLRAQLLADKVFFQDHLRPRLPSPKRGVQGKTTTELDALLPAILDRAVKGAL